MPPQLVLLVSLAVITWFMHRDTCGKPGVSGALWIPVVWLTILGSRPVSAWIGGGTGDYSVEDYLRGNPLDRYIYVALMIAALVVLWRRRGQWQQLIGANKMLVLLYAYLALSTLWAQYPLVSMRRLLKDAGSILMALVVLSEVSRPNAMRALFARCAWLLVPLSVVAIRYLPSIGRRYDRLSGKMWMVGVTAHKNALGATLVITAIPLVWGMLYLRRDDESRVSRAAPAILLVLMAWLLLVAGSATATACVVLGVLLLLAARTPTVRDRLIPTTLLVLCAVGALLVLEESFNILAPLTRLLNRDVTLTGRTNVWSTLISQDFNPLLGTGFYNFWSDTRYLENLPDWIAYSAHNGFVEMYLDGGLIGVTLLVMLILSVARRIQQRLEIGEPTAVLRAALFLVALIYNFSESAFGRIGPIWFVFLLIAIDDPWPRGVDTETAAVPASAETELAPTG